MEIIMSENTPAYRSFTNLSYILTNPPSAHAIISGSGEYPDLKGTVQLYQIKGGVLVAAEIGGLPVSDSPCSSRIFAFHIHEGGQCSGDAADPFADALTHYNPRDCPHPYHAGDMPPLFGSGGVALSIFLTDRFSVKEVIGKTVIVHSGLDDFSTQPSGNAGAKIGCGVIEEL